MSEQFPVTTICGSMRYYEQMLEVANQLTANGFIVLMPFVSYILPGDQEDNPVKEMLDEMHFEKIRMSDSIHVVGSYTGESTNREIAYAESLGRPVFRTAEK